MKGGRVPRPADAAMSFLQEHSARTRSTTAIRFPSGLRSGVPPVSVNRELEERLLNWTQICHGPAQGLGGQGFRIGVCCAVLGNCAYTFMGSGSMDTLCMS